MIANNFSLLLMKRTSPQLALMASKREDLSDVLQIYLTTVLIESFAVVFCSTIVGLVVYYTHSQLLY